MKIEIDSSIITQLALSEQEVKTEIAIHFFSINKLTLAQAAKLAGLHAMVFQKILATRKIPVHYDEQNFQEDLITMQSIFQDGNNQRHFLHK